jgi:hypothetical protein
LSILLIFVGVVLLLPSSSLVSLIASGSTATVPSLSARSATATAAGDTTTIESLAGFGLIGVGLVLEILSLFTEVGGADGMNTVTAEKIGAKQK